MSSVRDQYIYLGLLTDSLQGSIWTALRRSDEVVVVVKQAFKDCIKRKVDRKGFPVYEDFERECQIVHRLCKHENCPTGIMKLLHTWSTNESLCASFEFCKGGDLFDFIQLKNPRSLSDLEAIKHINFTQNIFCQQIRVVAWLHEKNIAHCDLSLENCFFFDEQQTIIKFGDFGLARQIFYGKWSRIGKIAYMSPEMYDGSGCDLELNDIWCLGVMLFMMLIGTSPFDIPHRTNIQFKCILNGELVNLLQNANCRQYVPDGALDILNKIFQFEDKRLNMKQLLNHPWIHV